MPHADEPGRDRVAFARPSLAASAPTKDGPPLLVVALVIALVVIGALLLAVLTSA